jgi:hypothetical protein
MIERLKMRYYPSLTLPKLSPETSETPAVHAKNNHKTGETGVSGEKPEKPPPLNTPWLQLDEIKAVYWNDGFFDWHPCAVCGYTKLTAWKAEPFKGEATWICEDCKDQWEKQHGF